MHKSLIIKCPCCGVEIDIDTATGKIVRTGPRPGEPQGIERFDTALQSVKSRAKDATAFDRAKEDLRKREAKLDDVFKDAFKRVKESGDEGKPFNPLEMD